MFKQRPDTDVSKSPEYNFLTFAGTVWKTKVKVALADVKRYTGRHDKALLVPESFDRTDPKYVPTRDMQMIAVLPVGTRVRIERLMHDNGNWGGSYVVASLEDGKGTAMSEHREMVRLDPCLLAKNRFIWRGSSKSMEWGVDPDMLEKAE